jgi:hypothetical protein
MTPFYLIEVIRLADSSFGGEPLKSRVVATCATKAECELQAERRARANSESGFDPIQDAWWGKSGELVCYYHQVMTRPRRPWLRFNESIGAAGGPGTREVARSRARPPIAEEPDKQHRDAGIRSRSDLSQRKAAGYAEMLWL